MIEHQLLITIVSTIVLGVGAQVLAERVKLPSIIFLLSIGVAFGPDGLNLVRPLLLREGLYVITALSIAIILFEGGLTLEIQNVRHVSRSVLNLISIGALVTWGGAAVVSWLVLDISWTVAILFGSLVIVTGPTVIGPLLRTIRVGRQVRTILKWEGILIDPVGAIVAVLVLGFVISEEATLGGTVIGFVGRVLIGTLIGLISGYLMVRLMRVKFSESIGTLVIFAVVFLIFGISEALITESGIMSVTIAGIVMGNMHVPNLEYVKGFKEKLTLLMVSVLFILLAANLRLAEVESLGWRGVLVVLGLMLVVRPLNIWASVREANLTTKEKLFLSWIAPRGIIAAAVASLFSLTLESHGFPKATLLTSLTFLTIAITVIVQGITAKPLAGIMGLLQAGTGGILILGGSGLTIATARQLKNHGIAAAILDSNKRNCTLAELEGITAYVGDVLDDRIWDEIDLSPYGSFLAATSNNELNSIACMRAAHVFSKENVYQLRHSYQSEGQAFTLSMVTGNQHYDLSLDILGISNDLATGVRRVEASPVQSMSGANDHIVLCGLGKGRVLFSTDKRVLGSADTVLQIVGPSG
jgi:NhaP-type Na+/H+ or K+/H+ antiporter